MEAELWERQTGVPVGTVSLRAGELTVDVADSAHRVLVERAMETGDITFAYVGYGEELTESKGKAPNAAMACCRRPPGPVSGGLRVELHRD